MNFYDFGSATERSMRVPGPSRSLRDWLCLAWLASLARYAQTLPTYSHSIALIFLRSRRNQRDCIAKCGLAKTIKAILVESMRNFRFTNRRYTHRRVNGRNRLMSLLDISALRVRAIDGRLD